MKILIACAALLMSISLNVIAYDPASAADLEDISQRYRSTHDEQERLKLCIEAINKNLVCKSCNIQAINRLFGTKFSTDDYSTQGDDGLFSGIVSFSPGMEPKANEKPKDNGPPSSAAYFGWHLGFKYDKNGEIRKYYLANSSQSTIGLR